MNYADGTHGAGAAPASADLERDQHATFTDQQSAVMALAFDAQADGITGHDVQLATGWGDSPKSRAMSNLLRDGKLVRLAEKRDNGHIHVLPEYVLDRQIEPFRSIADKHYRRGQADGLNAGYADGLQSAFDTVNDSDSLAAALIALRAMIDGASK